jgi:hypothetical protein
VPLPFDRVKSTHRALSITSPPKECAQTRPLSVVMAERMAALHAWAVNRTVSAD